MSEPKHLQFSNLEGLRGLASIAVVLHHMVLVFFPFIIFGDEKLGPIHSGIEKILHGNPLMMFLSGTFPVAIFFVLSGFVLSIGYFNRKDDDSLRKQIIRRYPRLMIPALFSILICALLIIIGFAKNIDTSSITGSSWLDNGWTKDPMLFSAIKEGIYGIFVNSGSAYNNVLWTMQIEFTGSLLVFLLIFTVKNIKYRKYIYAFTIIGLINTWYFAFIAGVILADLYSSGAIKVHSFSRLKIITITAIIIYMGGVPLLNTVNSEYYGIFSKIDLVNIRQLFLTIAAILSLYLVIFDSKIKRVFEFNKIQRLGKYTFSLYLIHLPILYTFTCSIFMFLFNYGLSYKMSALISLCVSIPLIAASTYLFERYIDSRSVRLSAKLADLIVK